MFEFMYQTLNEQYAPELEMYLAGKRLPELGVFPKIKFMEAKRLLPTLIPEQRTSTALLEPDFSPEEEKWLGEYFIKEYNSPIVFVTHYPAVKRPFYAMEDPRTLLLL